MKNIMTWITQLLHGVSAIPPPRPYISLRDEHEAELMEQVRQRIEAARLQLVGAEDARKQLADGSEHGS